jgi:TonB family protein
MRNKWVFGLAGVLGFLPFLVSASPQDSAADWVHQPSPGDIAHLYPVKARAKGIDGSAVIECTATVDGSLRACSIKSEAPEGYNFGRAALAMAPQFQLKPELKDGKRVEVKVDIPIHFNGPGTRVGSMIAGSSMQVGQKTMIANFAWTTTPTYADVVAVFPAKAREKKVGGKATLRCAFKDAGQVGYCVVQNDEPAGYGFGNAALDLVSHFQGPTTYGDGKLTKANVVTIPVVFPVGMADGSALYVTTPSWRQTPTPQMYAAHFPAQARKAGVSASKVVLGCTIGAEGELTQCSVNSENPAGLGFGEAVLAMAPTFRMRKWTEDGQAMIGRKIVMPISYQMDVKDAPTAAASPSAATPASPSAPAT